MKKLLMDIDQWMNKKEKLSRKQRVFRIFIYLSLSIFVITLASLIYSLESKILWLSIISVVFIFLSLILFSVYAHLEEQEFQRVTNKSIEYYKRRFPFFAQEFIAIVLCIMIAISFIGTNHSKLEPSILYSICIGTFSLVPIIYVFILPQLKETINYTRHELANILAQLTLSKKNSNISVLKEKQGEIYKLINSSNHTNSQLLISIALFILGIVMFFFPTNENFTQVYPTISIFYSLYELIMLIKLSHYFHTYSTREIENKMNNQIIEIKNKEKSNYKKELLKIYTKDCKYCGENSRGNCLKPNFKNLYKSAYIIIKNKKNKYFVYQQIIDEKKSEYCWQATYQCDELAKENVHSTFIKKIKDNFGIVLNKTSFKLINKSIDLNKNQIVEFYLIDENLTNSNIDYQIDLYIIAKFVSFKKFTKILCLSKNIPEKIIKEIIAKLTNENKSLKNS